CRLSTSVYHSSADSSFSTLSFHYSRHLPDLHSFPTRRSSDLWPGIPRWKQSCMPNSMPCSAIALRLSMICRSFVIRDTSSPNLRSEEHTSELQSLRHLVCRLLLEKKKQKKTTITKNNNNNNTL